MTAQHVAMALTMFDLALGRPSEADAANEALRQRIWFQAVAHVPVSIFRAACDRAVRECQFYPKPAEILEFARAPLVDLRRKAFPHAGRYSAADEELPGAPTPESIARVSKMVGDYLARARLNEKTAASEPVPASSAGPSPGLVDSCASRRARGAYTCSADCHKAACELKAV